MNEGDMVSLLDAVAIDGWVNVTHSTTNKSGKVPVRFIEKQLTNQF